jgi:adenylate kinase
MLRKNVKLKTPLGIQLSSLINEGHLVPDNIINKATQDELQKFDKIKASGCILDGFPRTVDQAKFLDDIIERQKIIAVHITLKREIAIRKLLERKHCVTCHRSFNTAHIVENGYDMPAILPDPSTCPKAPHCNPIYDRRSDDTMETIRARMEAFDHFTENLLKYYEDSNRLRTFNVVKGVKDTDDLWKCIKL